MNLELLFPAIYGLSFGTIVSILFGIYSKKTASEYSITVFGIQSFTLIKYISVLIASFSIALAAGFSVLIRDLKYPKAHPLFFTIEMLYASFVPSSVLFLMTYLREKPFTHNTVFDFFIISLKFGIVHLLLQTAGVYESVFSL
jgi:hypothetical protein